MTTLFYCRLVTLLLRIIAGMNTVRIQCSQYNAVNTNIYYRAIIRLFSLFEDYLGPMWNAHKRNQ